MSIKIILFVMLLILIIVVAGQKTIVGAAEIVPLLDRQAALSDKAYLMQVVNPNAMWHDEPLTKSLLGVWDGELDPAKLKRIFDAAGAAGKKVRVILVNIIDKEYPKLAKVYVHDRVLNVETTYINSMDDIPKILTNFNKNFKNGSVIKPKKATLMFIISPGLDAKKLTKDTIKSFKATFGIKPMVASLDHSFEIA